MYIWVEFIFLPILIGIDCVRAVYLLPYYVFCYNL